MATLRIVKRYGFMVVVALLAVVALTLGQGLSGKTPTAAAATSVTCGDVIAAPGNYQLSGSCGSAGISITSGDVHLNLAGFTMTGPVTNLPDCKNAGGALVGGGSVGVLVGAVSDVHVKGGTITRFVFGIQLNGTSASHFKGLTVTENCTFGFKLTDADNNRFNNNVVTDNVSNVPVVAGVFVYISGGYQLTGFGGSSPGSDGNKITSNDIRGNGDVGVHILPGSDGNTVRSSDTSDTVGGITTFGLGIIVRSAGNFIQGNTSSDNDDSGIAIDETGIASGNTVRSNTASGNGAYGIALFDGSTGNTVRSNTALGNTSFGLADFNAGGTCDANTWKSNTFDTSDPAPGGCIS